MSKTYRGWAEIEDWSHREFRRQHKRKAKKDWKKEVEEQMNETSTTVYLVINSWTPGEDNPQGLECSEVVGAALSEQGAWDILFSLAEGKGVDLPVSATSFASPPEQWLEEDYYYITDLEAF